MGRIARILDEDRKVVLVEHKTAARRWSEDQLRWDLQASIYWWAAQELGLGDVEIVYQVMLKTKKPGLVKYAVDRNEADVEELFAVMDGVLNGADAGAFFPSRGWACGGCQYGEVCLR